MTLVLIIARWNKKMSLIYSDDEKQDDRLAADESELMVEFRSASLASIHIDSRSSEIFIESFRRCRRTISANDLGGLFVEHSSAIAGSGNVTVSPSPRYIMSRSFLKSSLFFQLGTIDAAIRPFKATLFSFSPMKNSDVTGSPLGASSPLSLGLNFEAISAGSQISNLKRSGSLLVPCSSSNSTGSYQSNSPHRTVSKGIIYCVRKNGSLNLLFKEEDDKGKVFMTDVHKTQSSVDMAMDYLYTFRSTTGNKASEYVGKMRVFSSLLLNQDRSRSVETEFVLFGAEEHSKQGQNSTSRAIKNQCFSKKVAKMFRSNNSLKHRDIRKIGEPGFQLESFLQDFALSKSSDFEESKLVNHTQNGFRSSLELAAIVVKSSPDCIKNEAETGGWGLKFLERVTTDHADTSTYASLHSESSTSHVKNNEPSCSSIDVLIPAGFHGGPITVDKGRPSTLTERWRSGGRCDCGGWDIGCPLTVLHDRNLIAPKAFPMADDSHEDCKTVDLFIEGAKHAEPAFKMVMVAEGVFTVYFRRTLSALQAFSVGVAIIHSQTPELHPKL